MNDEELKEDFLNSVHSAYMTRTSLGIKRIPEKYKTRFMEIAKAEFANDYGLCLREMIRTWDGIFIDGNEDLRVKLDLLADEVSKLREELVRKSATDKDDFVVMADGTKRRM